MNIEGWPIQVFVEFLDHCPLEGKKLQLVSQVVGPSLAQAPTGIGYDTFGAILPGLVEDSSQAHATGISVKLEGVRKIGICKYRHCGREFLQVIKGLLTPAVPLDGSLFLACIFSWCQLVQRLCHLWKFRNESVVVLCKSQKTSDLCNSCGCGPIPDSLYFTFISGDPFGRNYMP